LFHFVDIGGIFDKHHLISWCEHLSLSFKIIFFNFRPMVYRYRNK